MKQIQAIDDVYPALDELIAELNAAGKSNLAAILHHRLHQVAWTTRSELLLELRNILAIALQEDDANLPEPVRDRSGQILRIIDGYLSFKS